MIPPGWTPPASGNNGDGQSANDGSNDDENGDDDDDQDGDEDEAPDTDDDDGAIDPPTAAQKAVIEAKAKYEEEQTDKNRAAWVEAHQRLNCLKWPTLHYCK